MIGTMKVSVIIPCYNEEAFVGQAIGSLLEQSRPPNEIIFVDDGSDDRSVEIARSFGEPVTVLPGRKGGAALARNYGADVASGDALMFFDADDVLGPHAMNHLIEHLARYPKDVVACPWVHLDNVSGRWVQRPPSCAPLRKDQDYLSGWLTEWYHPPCSVLWPRTAYERTGGWDPQVYVNDDGDLMMRALVDGVRLRITNRGEAFYRRLPAEQQAGSLSGARVTHAGRQSEIYVLRKIARRLEERGMLRAYRKPMTWALERLRRLCRDPYPDLSDLCTDLIRRYGEPWPVRIGRKINQQCYQVGNRGVRRARRLLNELGMTRTRQFLGHLKNEVLVARETSTLPSSMEPVQKRDEEITFGLAAYKEAVTNEGKSPVVVPSKPKVSVIIPACNRRADVGRALESVLNQTFEDFEVLIVEDAEGEGVENVLKRCTDSRFRYVRASECVDNIVAFNIGLREARGKYIGFLMAGCEWIPEKLARQLPFFESTSNTGSDSVGLVYSGVETESRKDSPSIFGPDRRGDAYRNLLIRNVIPGCSGVMIRSTVTASAGFFDGNLPLMAAHDYWLRIARYHDIEVIKEPLVLEHYAPVLEPNSSDGYIEAQRLFFEKHRLKMRREGVAQDFLLERARNELRQSSKPDHNAVRWIAFQALKEDPFNDEAYRFLLSRRWSA